MIINNNVRTFLQLPDSSNFFGTPCILQHSYWGRPMYTHDIVWYLLFPVSIMSVPTPKWTCTIMCDFIGIVLMAFVGREGCNDTCQTAAIFTNVRCCISVESWRTAAETARTGSTCCWTWPPRTGYAAWHGVPRCVFVVADLFVLLLTDCILLDSV